MNVQTEPVAIIATADHADIRVTIIADRAGRTFVDARTFEDTRCGPVAMRAPTRKGVTLAADQIGRLCDALLNARDLAIATAGKGGEQ